MITKLKEEKQKIKIEKIKLADKDFVPDHLYGVAALNAIQKIANKINKIIDRSSKDELIGGADHDVIWSVDIDEDGDCFSCFV